MAGRKRPIQISCSYFIYYFWTYCRQGIISYLVGKLNFYWYGQIDSPQVLNKSLCYLYFLSFFPPVPCPPGSFSPTGLAPCTLCNRRSFQPHNESRICVPCPGTTATVLPGTKNSQDCIGEWYGTPIDTKLAVPSKGHHAWLSIASKNDCWKCKVTRKFAWARILILSLISFLLSRN